MPQTMSQSVTGRYISCEVSTYHLSAPHSQSSVDKLSHNIDTNGLQDRPRSRVSCSRRRRSAFPASCLQRRPPGFQRSRMWSTQSHASLQLKRPLRSAASGSMSLTISRRTCEHIEFSSQLIISTVHSFDGGECGEETHEVLHIRHSDYSRPNATFFLYSLCA